MRKLSELRKETAERAAQNPVRYEKFSDRIKELIKRFNAGMLDAEETLDATEALAKEILAEDQAHEGTGLNKRAFGVYAILENFQAPLSPRIDSSSQGGDEGGESGLTAIQQAAMAIDELYGSDDTTPLHWQEKTQLKKDLRAQVRRLVKDLGLDGWQKQVPQAVEQYAVIHYRKP